MSNNNNNSGGIGFLGLLTVAFVVLKLTHYIDWSWWWVTCPLWIPFAMYLGFLLLMGLVALVLYLWNDIKLKRLQRRFRKLFPKREKPYNK